MQAREDMRISSVVDSPTPGPRHLLDQGTDLLALEQSVVDYGSPFSSPPKINPLLLALPSKDASPFPSDMSALAPHAHSWNLVQDHETLGSSSSSSPNIVLSAGVSHLLSCQRHHTKASKHKVLLNLELAAFALSWMAMVCFCSLLNTG